MKVNSIDIAENLHVKFKKNKKPIKSNNQETALVKNNQEVVSSNIASELVLLDAIKGLENNIQTDNNHPLSMSENEPIETFKKAMQEVDFIKKFGFNRDEASAAQANIKPEDVLYLFV